MDDDKKYPSDLAERFQVRMPPGLRDRISEAAKQSGRSMNSEIVHRLEQSFMVESASEVSQLKTEVSRQRDILERFVDLMSKIEADVKAREKGGGG